MRTHVIDKNNPPSLTYGGSIHSWQREFTPWHRSSFPLEFADQAPDQSDTIAEGWGGYDWCGNLIVWVPDSD